MKEKFRKVMSELARAARGKCHKRCGLANIFLLTVLQERRLIQKCEEPNTTWLLFRIDKPCLPFHFSWLMTISDTC